MIELKIISRKIILIIIVNLRDKYKTMLLFSFGKCSLKYLYPLVAGIIWIPIQYMTTILFINSLFDTDFYSFSPLLYSLLDQIGYILVGLFEILAIYIRRNKAYKKR